MKKSILSLLALLLTLTLSGVARAADPKITLELDEDLRIIVTLVDDDYKPASRFQECMVNNAFLPTPAGKSVELGRVRVGNSQPTSAVDRFVDNLLAPGQAGSVQCKRVGTSPMAVSVEPLKLKQEIFKKKTPSIQSSIAALSPGIDWPVFGPRFRDALLGVLGTPSTCEVVPKSKDVTCAVGSIDDVNGNLRLTVTGATDVQRLELKFNKASSVPVELNVAQCTYHAAGPLPYILAGASRQTLFLASQRPECQARLDRLTSLDANGFKPISVGSRPDSPFDVGQGKKLELSSIPATLSTGELTFILKANGATIGTATVPVLASISAGDLPKVGITYRLPTVTEFPEGVAARTNTGIAVVTPHGALDAKGDLAENRILNTVSIPIKPPLLASSNSDEITSFWKDKKDAEAKADSSTNTSAQKNLSGEALRSELLKGEEERIRKATSELRARSSTWLWRIRPTKGAPVFEGCMRDPAISSFCELKAGPGEIVFSLKEESPDPIEGALELVELVQGTDNPKPGESKPWFDVRSLFETTIRLAASARVESLPLPIRDRLYVDCSGAKTNITNSEMRAVNDDDVVNGTCALVLLPIPIGKPGPARDLSLYQDGESKLKRRDLVKCAPLAVLVENCEAKEKEAKADIAKVCAKERASYDKCSEPTKTSAFDETWRTPIDGWIRARTRNEQTRLLNHFYGSQRLIVVVKRDGKEIATKRWIVDPNQPTWLELPRGTDTERGNLYSVEVRVAARPTADVFYATAAVDNGKTDDGDLPQTELRFDAQLRSRGQFGFKSLPIRAYVTIPVQLGGFRFPAATNELRASSDPVIFQYMTPRTGLLGVLEPWSYDTGQNPWPLNPAIAGGLLAFDLAKPRVNVSTLLGIQVQAPLLKADTNQLTSALALGLFWEHSVEEKENRVLFTFGANVLSLFAGK